MIDYHTLNGTVSTMLCSHQNFAERLFKESETIIYEEDIIYETPEDDAEEAAALIEYEREELERQQEVTPAPAPDNTSGSKSTSIPEDDYSWLLEGYEDCGENIQGTNNLGANTSDYTGDLRF